MGKASRRRREGHQRRQVQLDPKSVELLQEQKRRFVEKFGREPGLNDPVFFDPNASEPTSFNLETVMAETIRMLEEAGADPATIYAVKQTGMLPPIPGHGYSKADLREWDAAIAYYHFEHTNDPTDPDQGMTAFLADLVANRRERLPDFMIELAGLLAKKGGLTGIDELQGRIAEVDGEDGTVLSEIFTRLLGWVTEIRDSYPLDARERAIQVALQYAAIQPGGISAAVMDMQGLMVPTNADLTIGELFERHDGQSVFLGAWALIHGAVTVLGNGDARFLERLRVFRDDS